MKKRHESESGMRLDTLLVEDLLPQQEAWKAPHEKLMMSVRPVDDEWGHMGIDEYERRD
jgi:hypothetical protein